jgi:hypothetical protein
VLWERGRRIHYQRVEAKRGQREGKEKAKER